MATSSRVIGGEDEEVFPNESLPLAGSGRKMPVGQMSPSEIAFAFLVDSYTVASEPLNNFVTSAVKDKFSGDWKYIICSCFSSGVKQHVKDNLDNNRPLRDIFVICKIIRSRLDDLIAYMGENGKQMDERDKKRLSFQMEGVEAARHMAFHGEFVSLPEVHSCVLLLISILTTFCCGREHIAKLHMMEDRILQTSWSESVSDKFESDQKTVFNVMLHRSLGEFEREFGRYVELNMYQNEGALLEKFVVEQSDD